jgi:hypothetical protein
MDGREAHRFQFSALVISRLYDQHHPVCADNEREHLLMAHPPLLG